MSKFSIKEQNQMLLIAREAILTGFTNKEMTMDNIDSNILNEKCGVFVTIKKDNKLRGCVGLLTSDYPLPETITRMAKSAATQDGRFSPLKIEELNDINLEISILSPFETISNIEKIVIGVHGLYISSGDRHGLLLPQVAVENKWDINRFVEHTCIKAGLPTLAWMDSKTTIQIFTAEIFDDKSG